MSLHSKGAEFEAMAVDGVTIMAIDIRMSARPIITIPMFIGDSPTCVTTSDISLGGGITCLFS